MTYYKIFALSCFVVLLTSCSGDLNHTWHIDKYEIFRESGKNSTYSNIGTITFEKGGQGHNNFQIIEENLTDKAGFTWEKKHDLVLIKPMKNFEKSKLAKAWIIVEDNAKKQIWKSTDGDYQVQVLELSR